MTVLQYHLIPQSIICMGSSVIRVGEAAGCILYIVMHSYLSAEDPKNMKGACCLRTMLSGFTNARSISLLYVLHRCTIVNYTTVSWLDPFKDKGREMPPMDVEIIGQAPYRRGWFSIS